MQNVITNKDLLILELTKEFAEQISNILTGNFSLENFGTNLKSKADLILKKYHTCKIFNKEMNNKKILVIGNSVVKVEHLIKIANSLGISKESIDFAIGYNEIKNKNILTNIKNKERYSDVLIGPIPHSLSGKEGTASIFGLIEKHKDDYPNIIKLTQKGGKHDILKITKEGFKEGLKASRFLANIKN